MPTEANWKAQQGLEGAAESSGRRYLWASQAGGQATGCAGNGGQRAPAAQYVRAKAVC